MLTKQQKVFDRMGPFSAFQAAALRAAKGKRTHRVIVRYESFCRRFRFVLRCAFDRLHNRLRDLRDRQRQRNIRDEEAKQRINVHNRLRGLCNRRRQRSILCEQVKQRVNAWTAHANHVNTWRLRHTVFQGGWTHPSGEPDCALLARPSRRVLEQ